MVKGLMALSRRLRGSKESTEELIFRRVLGGEIRAGVKSLPLVEGVPVRIGRDPSNDIALDVESVSSQHAQLKLAKGRVWIRDLNSKAGTRVNAKPVVPLQWIAIRSTDSLSLGAQDITLELELEPLVAGRGAVPERSPNVPVRHYRAAESELDVPKLVGALVLLALFVLMIAKGCQSAPPPPVQQPMLRWRLFGTVQVKKTGKEAVLVITVPEVPTTVKKAFQPDANGSYQFDFDLKLKADKPPTRLEVELQQDGKILGAARDLKLPPPGESLQLPSLGKASKRS